MTDTPKHPLANPTRQITIEIPPAVAIKLSEWHEGPIEDAALAGLKLYHGMGPSAYAQLQQAAKTLETTPAKALRTAIELLTAQANKLRPSAATARGRPTINQDRDTAIFLRVTEGATYAEAANAFRLSIVRVGQIMAQQRTMRGLSTNRGARSVFVSRQRSDLATVLMRMDSEGMTRADAAEAAGMTVEQIDQAFAAYKAALPANPTKGDRAAATFAGTHALEKKDEVLSLEDSDTPTPTEPTPAETTEPPRKLVIIPPSMRNQTQPQPMTPAPEKSLQEHQRDFDELMGEL
jgi:hypothetical protein